jgi:hypothetical protein
VSAERSDTADRILNLKGNIPEVVFDKYDVKGFGMDASTHGGIVDITTHADKFYMEIASRLIHLRPKSLRRRPVSV